jgi:hypothetical protein
MQPDQLRSLSARSNWPLIGRTVRRYAYGQVSCAGTAARRKNCGVNLTVQNSRSHSNLRVRRIEAVGKLRRAPAIL